MIYFQMSSETQVSASPCISTLFLFSLLSTGCRTDVEVKLLAGVQHVSFRAYHQHGRQTDVGREIGILDGYHTLQVGTFRVCEFIS